MIHVDLEQGSREWLQWRKGGIGGSDAAAVLGLSPFKSRQQLLLELTGQVQAEEANYAMRRGTRLEPVARREYEERIGRTMPAICGQHDELEWMRASFDGLSLCGEVILEIKWPNVDAHQAALSGTVPEYYLCQVQHQLYVSGASVCHYWSCSENKRFRQDELFALVEVRPDAEYIGRLLIEEMSFWEEIHAYRSKGKTTGQAVREGARSQAP